MSKRLADIYHNLALMVEAGVPLKRCLKLAVGTTRGRYGEAFEGLAEGIMKGNTLAQTMPSYPKAFDPLDIMVVDAGEASGELAECLNHLSNWYTFRNKLRHIISQGLVFPVFVLHVGALLMPLPSVFMAGLSLREYELQVLSTLSIFYVPFIAIILITKLSPRGSLARRILDEISILIPILNKAVLALAISRFTNAFYTLYSAGIPITECTRKSCEITGNTAVAKMFAGGAASALAGNEVSAGFSRKLPADYIASWQVGEESGQLDEVTRRLAVQTQQRAEMMFAQLAEWLPRVVYFIVMLFLIMGVLRGYSQIYGNLGNFENF